jgi:uncharacterized membrane protein
VTRPDLPSRHSARATLASTQLLVATFAGVLAGVPLLILAPWQYAPLACWDVAAAVYMTWVWVVIWNRDAENTALLAVHTDPTRAITDLLLLGAAAISLIAVAFVMARAASAPDSLDTVMVAVLGLVSVALSWAVVHTVFTLRYARLYYTGTDGGVDFNQDEPPRYSDFAYLSFTIGMTSQVADTCLNTEQMRRTVLRHALLSYLFATGILAAAINVVVSLTGP